MKNFLVIKDPIIEPFYIKIDKDGIFTLMITLRGKVDTDKYYDKKVASVNSLTGCLDKIIKHKLVTSTQVYTLESYKNIIVEKFNEFVKVLNFPNVIEMIADVKKENELLLDKSNRMYRKITELENKIKGL